MRKVLLFMLVCLIISGCAKNGISEGEKNETTVYSGSSLNPLGIDSAKLIDGEYLFFLDESKYLPLIKVDDTDFSIEEVDLDKVDALKKKIQLDLDSAFSLKLPLKHIFATTFSGFFVSGISVAKANEILSTVSLITSGQNNFTIQNVRATMQAPGPIPQNTRPSMQEWQYDSIKKTSSKVLYVNPTLTSGNSAKKIWIVDSGVDASHSDLNVITDPAFSVSFVHNEPNALVDVVGHGTHCAGIAAGKARYTEDGMLGMNGVSPNAPIVSVKVINWNGEGKWSDVKFAFEHIFEKSKAGDVVSASFGDLLPGAANVCNFQNGVLNAIEKLAGKGVSVVMAAGNTGIDSKRFYPACYDRENVFTIGSLSVTYGFGSNLQFSTPSFSTYSNFGSPPIDYVAPGDFVFSTFPGNRYAILSGTSMSTAMVAGIIHAKGGGPNGSEYLYRPPSTTRYLIAKY
ncbi:S8 family peptidase [Algoriphagus terrigena]|uniref:S8 family peptidase n=1 Tax=Algoriphagus terrigena TaxID=344884 RepID=UPI00041DAD09|nr:S8 family serine peptidase [Algoriphagus terrigena]